MLEIIDAHTGNFCVESFDPFIVAWFRFHAPDLLRGQLTAQRDDLGSNLGAWLSSRMLIGCIGRPQFIAHRTGKKSFGVKLAELLGAMRVTWTAHDRSEEAKCDTVIFEAYRRRYSINESAPPRSRARARALLSWLSPRSRRR